VNATTAITMKGIRREVVPYEVEALMEGPERKTRILSEHLAGLDLHLDLGRLAPAEHARVRETLAGVITALDAAVGDKGTTRPA
jgi:hypothetical protein